ncbi:restriction endonuclease [Methylomonas sp. CM2]|uniref:restriction endonuclease n=1 Tax=Methylomonas sp. CM2 TaxID=3417647 RepID=UPI003CF3FF9A
MSNRIFDHEPEDWHQLEDMVNTAFLEMGYESHQNHSVGTVRGDVKIDVFATDLRTPIPTVVLCECKYWNKPVDQSVIYAFRSICSDVGAHYGIVISKVGFQSGAKETREATNVHLMDFRQFQENFFAQW